MSGFWDIDQLPILSKKAAIACLGGPELFENMIESFEDLTLRKNLRTLKIALDDVDYAGIHAQAHSLKGSAGYLHAERVTRAAEKIERDVDLQLPNEIFKDYPQLIKQCIVLKRAIRREILHQQGSS